MCKFVQCMAKLRVIGIVIFDGSDHPKESKKEKKGKKNNKKRRKSGK